MNALRDVGHGRFGEDAAPSTRALHRGDFASVVAEHYVSPGGPSAEKVDLHRALSRSATSPARAPKEPHTVELTERLLQARQSWCLTERQIRVLQRLVSGEANKEIAKHLSCAENTVEFHVTAMLKKAGVDNRTRLIAHFWTLD